MGIIDHVFCLNVLFFLIMKLLEEIEYVQVSVNKNAIAQNYTISHVIEEPGEVWKLDLYKHLKSKYK